MALAIRVTGWMLFAAGALTFILNGSFQNIRSPLTMVAMVAMPAGMILTGISNLIEHFVRLRRRQAEITSSPTTPPAEPAPDPDKPEKHYKVRPLDPKPEEKPPTG